MAVSKKRKYIISTAAIIVILLLLILKIRSTSGSDSIRPLIRPAVVISVPANIEMERSISLTGDILPFQQANIYSKVNGNIEKIFSDIGDAVHQNQVLALIDTTIYSQNVRQANANYIQAVANNNNAKINMNRNKTLYDQNLISKQDLDNSNTSYEVSSAQKDAALANLRNNKTLLDYCRVIAPFSGIITKRFLDAGAYVTSSTTSPSSTLFILMDINTVKVNINVPEKNVYDLNKVNKVIVSVDALNKKEFEASIKKINQALDLATRTLIVEVDINNKDHILKPGMFATVRLILEKKPNTLAVPLQSVLRDDNGDYVFKVGPDSIARKSYIKTGIANENFTEVVGGLLKDEKIITVGQSMVRNNMKVRMVR
jgi:membrane fusion protein, multidrug efflux system